jgi:hypothetical protein
MSWKKVKPPLSICSLPTGGVCIRCWLHTGPATGAGCAEQSDFLKNRLSDFFSGKNTREQIG